jgi:hypothetical protein
MTGMVFEIFFFEIAMEKARVYFGPMNFLRFHN